MQSSSAMVCRALVMLACLIAIPLAAIFGTSLPDLAKGLLDGRLGRLIAHSKSPRESPPEAPPFVPGSPGRSPFGQTDGFPGGPVWSGRSYDPAGTQGVTYGSGTPRGADNMRSPDPISTATGAQSQGDAVWANYESRDEPPPWSAAPRWPERNAGPSGWDESRPTSRQPVDVPSAGREPIPSYPATSPTRPQPPQATDRFTYIQRRLRELGATYYLLETWGNQGQYFRFHCRIAIGGNANYTRHFEATDTDSLEAMASVLQDVEAWRAGR